MRAGYGDTNLPTPPMSITDNGYSQVYQHGTIECRSAQNAQGIKPSPNSTSSLEYNSLHLTPPLVQELFTLAQAVCAWSQNCYTRSLLSRQAQQLKVGGTQNAHAMYETMDGTIDLSQCKQPQRLIGVIKLIWQFYRGTQPTLRWLVGKNSRRNGPEPPLPVLPVLELGTEPC
ncbi:hypothetical protein RRG08_016289 [Elysia crispata]|uniref:Uncharacterized protein n=1 Tax=Elysia crispata TaxID=231223 RepID=A0AAE1B5Z7_9GAST|nr:hypothetical protein RRG08_016289 [Elysia crispata]